MATPPSPLLFALGLVALVAPLESVVGKSIIVTNPNRGGGSCPGIDCTLRGAWGAMELNDTIVLNVSVNLVERLQWVAPDVAYPSTITITAARPGLSVTGAQCAFLRIRLRDQPVKVSLQGFALTGFDTTQAGDPLICVDQGDIVCKTAAGEEGPRPVRHLPSGEDARPSQQARLTADRQRRLWEAKGEVPQIPPFFELSEMEIVHNNHSLSLGFGLIYTASYPNRSIAFTNVVFKGNRITQASQPIGVLTFHGEYANPAMLFMKNVQVVGNSIVAHRKPDVAAALFLTVGNTYAMGLQVEGNLMGHGSGVLSSSEREYGLYGDIFMEDSSLAANIVPFSTPSAALSASHVHLKRVLLETAGPNAIWSKDDQYLSSCTLTAKGGAAPLLEGWQFFNRDPTRTLGSTSTTLGFANCTAAADWFPCPPYTPTCTDLFSPTGSSVGYSCS